MTFLNETIYATGIASSGKASATKSCVYLNDGMLANVCKHHAMKILRLIENMTLDRNAVGYLTESVHGAGSPQAQRIQIGRKMQLEEKKKLAKKLAGID